MVQAVENWTCVTGKVLSVTPDPKSGRLHLQLRIERTSGVAGFPDLLKAKPGDVVDAALPSSLKPAEAPPQGKTVTLPVRLARGPKLFAHPDWLPGQKSPLC